MSVIFVMIIFLKISNVKDARLHAALHVSIGFIFLTITAALYVGIKNHNI